MRNFRAFFIFTLILSFYQSSHVFAVDGDMWGEFANKIRKDRKGIVKQYWSHHKKFFAKTCRPGTEEKFWQYFRDFRGDGHYLPRTVNDKLDRKTLNRFIPELRAKRDWIQKQKKTLSKIKSFKALKKELKSLESDVQKLVSFKEAYEDSTDDAAKVSIRTKSKYLFLSFKARFTKFLKKVPYFTSYRYPVDHFELRENYDEVKGSKKEEGKQRANEVYFYRKVVQDGAQDRNRSRSDTFLRSMLDTLVLSMKEKPDIITENIRYDLFSAFSGLQRQLKRRPSTHYKRFMGWESRVTRMLEFYNSLKKNKVRVGSRFETGDQIIETQAKARAVLKDYVFKRHAEVYNFWAKLSPIHRALYVITTTLYNEVGSIDGSDALERKDVVQVVLNRVENQKYNFIPKEDFLYSYFVKGRSDSELQSNKWLNVMFKEGEFSFTYYFIHGAVRVFCPDMSRIGRRLRKKNLSIALDSLANTKRTFAGIRYFSRASMLGRISMDDIWTDYRPIAERPGRKISKNVTKAKILKAYKAGDYKYRYHFFDGQGRKFKVIDIKDKTYSMRVKTQELFTYRNPHYFRYFESIK
jgi:hypothetical protein